MSFPKNLVAYEIALERAFRMMLGSQMDTHVLPDQNSVGDAFFRQLEPGDFARQWLQEEKYRFHESPALDAGSGTVERPPGEDELF
ncbi:MAG: hypothetical protein ACFCUX_04995 [Candidatus Methylacidiphilales bacterium]